MRLQVFAGVAIQDIAKLRTVRGTLFQQEIYCLCYFVMENTPTDSVRAAGKEQNIHVKSAEEFQNEFLTMVVIFISGVKNSLAV